MLDTQLNQTSGFGNSHYTKNIFAHASSDHPLFPSVDPMNPPEFDDPPFKCFGDSSRS